MCWGRGRTGRPAANSQKNNSSPLAQSQEKTVEHPHGQEALEPGEALAEAAWTLLLLLQLRTSLVQGAPHYAGPCLPRDDLAKLSGSRREEGWDGNKALWEHRLAQSTLGDTGIPAHTKPRPCSFAPGQRQQKPHDSGWFSRAEKHDQGRRTGSTGSAAQPLSHCPHTGTPPVRVTCAWQLPGDAAHPSCPSPGSSSSGPLHKALPAGELFVSAVTSRCSLNSFGVSCREVCQELQ